MFPFSRSIKIHLSVFAEKMRPARMNCTRRKTETLATAKRGAKVVVYKQGAFKQNNPQKEGTRAGHLAPRASPPVYNRCASSFGRCHSPQRRAPQQVRVCAQVTASPSCLIQPQLPEPPKKEPQTYCPTEECRGVYGRFSAARTLISGVSKRFDRYDFHLESVTTTTKRCS